jgi:hypothetical protein
VAPPQDPPCLAPRHDRLHPGPTALRAARPGALGTSAAPSSRCRPSAAVRTKERSEPTSYHSGRLWRLRAGSLVPFDELRWRRPAVRRLEIPAKSSSKSKIRAGFVTRDRELELSVRSLGGGRPHVECDLRLGADEEKSLTILLGELPPFRKHTLGVRTCGDEIRIVVTAAEQAHGRGVSARSLDETRPAFGGHRPRARLGRLRAGRHGSAERTLRGRLQGFRAR